MPAIAWTLNSQITGGPRVTDSGTLTVEAYDVVEKDLEPGSDGVSVDVQPGDADGQVALLLITAKPYSKDVQYEVNDKTIHLDAAQLFMGREAIRDLLGKEDSPQPVTLKFKNGSTERVSLRILAARDAAASS